MKSKAFSILILTLALAALLSQLTRCLWANGPGFEQDLAVRIELELLADPITFPYDWHIEVANQAVEVAGVVPNEGVRTRAIQLVAQITALPVKDRIKVHPLSLPTRTPRSPRELGEAVQRKLEQARLGGPTGFAEIDIYPDSSGVVTLRGRVASLADKLLASRCLQEVPHCLAVRNYLVIDPHLASAQASATYSDTPSENADNYTTSDPFVWRPRSSMAVPKLAQHPPSAPLGQATAPRLQPLYPSMRQLLDVNTLASHVSSHVVHTSPNSFVTVTEGAYGVWSGTPHISLHSVNGSFAVTQHIPANPGQPISIPGLKGQPMVPVTSVAQPEATKSNDYRANASTLSSSVMPLTPGERYNSSQVLRTDYQTLPKPRLLDTTVAPTHGSTNSASSTFAPTTNASPLSYPSLRGLPSVPNHTASSHSVRSEQSNIISPSGAAMPTGITPLSPISTANTDDDLRRRILTVLGPSAKDVQIVRGSDKSIQVTVKIRSNESADQIATRLFQIPDLEGCQLHLVFGE